MEKVTDNRPAKKLLIMLILFAVFQATAMIFFGFDYGIDLAWTVESLILLSAGILMYNSYRNHTKNVMKPVLGATLAIVMYYNMNIAMSNIHEVRLMLESATMNVACIVYAASQLMVFIALALMNVMHYVINSTHHSSPKKIKCNRILYVLFVIFSLANSVSFFFSFTTLNLKISHCVGMIADFFLVSMVVSIESFLDEFRLEREADAEAEAEAERN